MSYDGLVLDHDGVLMRMAASETITDAVVAAFAAAGVTDPRPADIDKLTVGVDPEDVRAVAERHGLDPATLWEYREAAVHEALQDATVAGAKGPYDDVGVLRDLDCPLGIASNNQSRTVSYMLDHHDLLDLFVAVHARESTFETQPGTVDGGGRASGRGHAAVRRRQRDRHPSRTTGRCRRGLSPTVAQRRPDPHRDPDVRPCGPR